MRIDAHLHFPGDRPESVALLDEYDLKLVNVCVAEPDRPWRERQAVCYDELHRSRPDRYAWITSFDLPDFDDPDYYDRVRTALDADFAGGAVGCKVWKDIGMNVKTPDGAFMQIDDPFFEPIWDHLIAAEMPLLMHIGEPLCCWLPLNPDDPHYSYYFHNPQWHMHGRTDFPHHREIMAARDRMVAAHPKLLCVGAHLASLEWNVAEVAQRFEAMPNFRVDTSARLWDLVAQEAATVRAFFVHYADRILWGTDDVAWPRHSTLDDEALAGTLDYYRGMLRAAFAYFEQEQTLDHQGRTTPGLSLPEKVLERIYRTNAEACYPGL